MTYEAKIKVQFDSKWTYTGSYGDDDMLPEEHITMEIPAEDLNTCQAFKFFSNFLRAIGHNEIGIMKGACNAAFNEYNREEDMRKVADEYDLTLAEDLTVKIKEAVEKERNFDATWVEHYATIKKVESLQSKVQELQDRINHIKKSLIDDHGWVEEHLNEIDPIVS
jgi:hypothetical protein